MECPQQQSQASLVHRVTIRSTGFPYNNCQPGSLWDPESDWCCRGTTHQKGIFHHRWYCTAQWWLCWRQCTTRKSWPCRQSHVERRQHLHVWRRQYRDCIAFEKRNWEWSQQQKTERFLVETGCRVHIQETLLSEHPIKIIHGSN